MLPTHIRMCFSFYWYLPITKSSPTGLPITKSSPTGYPGITTNFLHSMVQVVFKVLSFNLKVPSQKEHQIPHVKLHQCSYITQSKLQHILWSPWNWNLQLLVGASVSIFIESFNCTYLSFVICLVYICQRTDSSFDKFLRCEEINFTQLLYTVGLESANNRYKAMTFLYKSTGKSVIILANASRYNHVWYIAWCDEGRKVKIIETGFHCEISSDRLRREDTLVTKMTGNETRVGITVVFFFQT